MKDTITDSIVAFGANYYDLSNASSDPVNVLVWWPSGRPGNLGTSGSPIKPEEWTNVVIDRYTTLKEGSGK